jgi:uncharacterized protein
VETDSAAQSRQTPQAQPPQAQAPERPAPQIWDQANALGPNDLDAIRERQREAQERNQVAIHVATIDRMVDYPEYNKGTIESFARGWYETKCPEPWGVLVLVAVEDREARIHFDENWGKRADAYALRVMQDQMVPRFKLRNYGAGVSSAVDSLAQLNPENQKTWKPPFDVRAGIRMIGKLLPPVLFMILLVAIVYFAINVLRYGGGGSHDDHYRYRRHRHRDYGSSSSYDYSPSSFFSSSSGSSSSGGWTGGGGGGGGGGASGSW